MLLQNIRAKIGARLNGDKEAGFTLIELLVVMLILGILAAIALPAFFNQKDKAGDAKAKANLHSAQVAMETCASENEGKYSVANCDQGDLNAIEPTIPAAEGPDLNADPAADEEGYTLISEGTSGDFEIVNDNGTISFLCEAPGDGGCPGPANAQGKGVWGP